MHTGTFEIDKLVFTGKPDPEEARQVRESLTQPHMERFQDATGIDGANLLEQLKSPRFRFSEVHRSIRESAASAPRHVQEAITLSQGNLANTLVVVHTVFDDYGAWPAIYRDLAEIEASTGEDEVYPEEWADDMPVATAENEPAPSARASVNAVRIRNYVYTRELEISKRYFNMDKVGRVKRLAANFGKKYPQAIDKAFVYGLFKAGQVSQLIANGGIVPPFAIAGQQLNPPAGFNPQPGAVTPQRIEDGVAATAFYVDPYGVELTVDFDTIFVDKFDFPKVRRFLTSDKLAVIPAYAQGSDTTGQAAGAFTDNPLKGSLQIAKSPYVRKARASLSGSGFPWVLMTAKQGAVVQIVHELQVEQESPESGDSHNQRMYRWQGVIEFGTGLRNGRLFFWGN